MTPSLTIATTATDTPMGAQAYQVAIRERAEAALGAAGEEWTVHNWTVRSLRSSLPGDRRLPMGWLRTAGPTARRAFGAFVYRPRTLVHRMDLILPPPPGHDVLTLHDIVAWEFEDEAAATASAAEELRRADAVICVSSYTAEQASARFGLENTVVVPNGVSPAYFDAEPLDEHTRLDLGLRDPYLLYAGGSARRKNLAGLAAAWRKVAPRRPDWQLALAGPDNPERRKLFDGLPRVVHLGRLPDELMPRLAAGAGACVVPSLAEGFGLPALEAMAVGVPLVATNRTSLPEVVGDTGTLVEPTAEGLSEGIEHVTSQDPTLLPLTIAARVRAREYTWERSAAGHAEVWRRVRFGPPLHGPDRDRD